MKELTGKWELTGKTDSANMFMWCRGKEKNICKHAYNTHTHKFVFVWLNIYLYLYSALLCIAVHPLYNHVGTFHWLFYSTALFTLANYFQFLFFCGTDVFVYIIYINAILSFKKYILYLKSFSWLQKRDYFVNVLSSVTVCQQCADCRIIWGELEVMEAVEPMEAMLIK